MKSVLFIVLLNCIVDAKFLSNGYHLEDNIIFRRTRTKREASLLYNDEKTFFDQNKDTKSISGRSPKSSVPRQVRDGAPPSPQNIRLRGDGELNYNEGRVEVYDAKSRSWGLVCDDYWVMKDANVTCRELGFYKAAREANRGHRYGRGHWRENDYTLQGVNCMGNEKSLFDCARDLTTFCSTKSAGLSCIYNDGCEAGWASFNGACYQVFTQQLSYKDAEKFCQDQTAKLTYILTPKENNFLSNMLYNKYKSIIQVWTGGYYAEVTMDSGKVESKWNWYSTIHNVAGWNMSGLWFPGFYDWKSDSRPQGDRKTQSCVALNRFYQDSKRDNQIFDVNYFWWDNLSCQQALPFICQKNIPKGRSDCYNDNGNDYRGRISRTVQGSVCAKWTTPQAAVNPESNPNMGLGDHNFCRNPDNDVMPWCWVNPAAGVYGYCAVGKCSEVPNIPIGPTTSSPPGFGQGGCQNEEYNCPSMVQYNRNCIAKRQVCDKVADCNNKEDEDPAFCQTCECFQFSNDEMSICIADLCKPNEFFCKADMYCILQNFVCDQTRNCRDGADEVNCTQIEEPEILAVFDKFNGKILATKDKMSYYQLTVAQCMQTCKTLFPRYPCKSFNYLPPNATRYYSECQLLTKLQSEEPNSLISINYVGAHYSLKSDCTGKFKCSSGLCVEMEKKCNGQNDCGDSSDEVNCASVTYPPFSIRLVGSENKWEGSVEIRYQGEWGFVCDDKFDLKAANVACKQLGFIGAVQAIESAVKKYGKIIGPVILLDELTCKGTEASIEECSHNPWRQHNCQPDEIAGVVCKIDRACTTEEFRCNEDKQCINMMKVCDGVKDCSDGSDEPAGKCDIKINLVNGKDTNSGRIEVVKAYSKGTVCDDGYDDNDAKVICRMLGIPGVAKAITDGRFGPGTGRIALGNLQCLGTEESLEKCPFFKWGDSVCTHKEDVGIICGSTEPVVPILPTLTPTKAPDIPTESKCGNKPITQKRARVVGGFEALYGAFPWQVGVRQKAADYDYHWCGATILSEDWIIGAAHCYTRPKSDYRVRTGDWDNANQDKHEQVFEIEELIIHPNWNSANYDHDLALIKVQRVNGDGIKFNNYVQPACLTKVGDQPDTNTKCLVSGWGDTLSQYPEKLLAAEVPLLSRAKCDDMYKGRLTDRMQCAGYEAGGIDTCQGDSGGPLVCKVKGLYTILGATSWGNGCAQPRSPGVYAKIEVMLDWVKQMTRL